MKQKEQEQNFSAPNCCHWFEWLIPFSALWRSLIFLPHDGASYYCCINHPLHMGMSLLGGVQWRPYLYLSAGGNLLWFFSRRKALCLRKKQNSVDCLRRLSWTVKKCSLLMKFLPVITRTLTSLLAYLDSPVCICLEKKKQMSLEDVYSSRGWNDSPRAVTWGLILCGGNIYPLFHRAQTESAPIHPATE